MSRAAGCQAYWEDFTKEERKLPCEVCVELGDPHLGGSHPRAPPTSPTQGMCNGIV
jgi:hypothetical protein